jgi:hypothetical protein
MAGPAACPAQSRLTRSRLGLQGRAAVQWPRRRRRCCALRYSSSACNACLGRDLWRCESRTKELPMSVQLLVIYPPPKDPAEFDRAYRNDHLPFAGPRLVGATGVTTKRVLGAPGGTPFAHWISKSISRVCRPPKPVRNPKAAKRPSITRLRSHRAARRNFF